MKLGTKSLIIFILFVAITSCYRKTQSEPFISNNEQRFIINSATQYIDSLPVTVTSTICDRSEGGIHDFYSEGDYWWPNPKNPNGPFIRRDGHSNPENFVAHRMSMIRMSKIVGIQTSAYLLTGDLKFVKATQKHLEAWFVDPKTRMNPSLNYAQAIKGVVSGRGIGIIDAIHLVEVARSIEILKKNNVLPKKSIIAIDSWFSRFLHWLITSKYGIDEMNAKNNHGTCWVMQVSAYAHLTNDKKMINFCRKRFKNVLLPNQMDRDGSFPLELKRTKPYGYSLFNLDVFMTTAKILSDNDHNLFSFSTKNGLSLRLGAKFLFPFVRDKSKWPFPHDVMYWDKWPVRQAFLLFAGIAYHNKQYIETWEKLNGYPETKEVLRNMPVKSPVIWLLDKPLR